MTDLDKMAEEYAVTQNYKGRVERQAFKAGYIACLKGAEVRELVGAASAILKNLVDEKEIAERRMFRTVHMELENFIALSDALAAHEARLKKLEGE